MAGHVDPERAAFEAFKDLPRDEPIHMLNLVRFRDAAEYEDDRSATGAEAYREYGKESGPVFARVGGRIAWAGRPDNMLIGPETESWDAAFIAEYPNASAFLEMVTDPDYQRAVKHRQAAVADSRLIRMKPRSTGGEFG